MSRRHKTYTNCRIVNKSFYMEAKPFAGGFWKGCARLPPFGVSAGRDNFLDGPYPILGQKNAREPGGGTVKGAARAKVGAAAVLRRKGWR